MAGVSTLALLATGAAGTARASGQFRSLAQALSAAAHLQASMATTATQGARTAALGARNLAAAAARFRSLAEALAALPSAATASAPNGFNVPGALVPAAGYNVPGNLAWQGVSSTQPVSTSASNGGTVVTIHQAKPAAILNWKTFNIGARTTVQFDQSAGGSQASSWVVLNRISDPAQAPTAIFGRIEAAGSVYVLNVNGVLFEPGSQVNLHSLVAGGATMSDSQFLNFGLQSPLDNIHKGGQGYLASFVGTGPVEVASGALLETTPPASVQQGGGSIILLGSSAQNDGTILTPAGQVILGAGQDFVLRNGFSIVPAGSSGAPYTASTTLGEEIETDGSGVVTNNGLIEATTGDITLVGDDITQAGVLYATTAVNRRGTIHLLTSTLASNGSPGGGIESPTGPLTLAPLTAPGTITLAAGSVTEIAPDPGSGTAVDSQQASAYASQTAYAAQPNIPNAMGGAAGGGIAFNDQVQSSDRPGISRIEITAGGLVDFAADSLTIAPAGQISVSAVGTLQTVTPSGSRKTPPKILNTGTGEIFADSGAMLDVSGLSDVTVPITQDTLSVAIEGSGLRDAPNNRDSGLLNNIPVTVDLRNLIAVAPSLTYTAGTRYYTAGGLLEVGGQLALIPHSISEWSTIGGAITLTGTDVVAKSGSTFNLAGGAITYAAGDVPQSYLIGPSGQLYNINTAPSFYTYSGIYRGDVVTHPRWHLTDIYNNPLAAPATLYEPDYVDGRDAGTLVLSTANGAFDGAINGGVQTGAQQSMPHRSTSDPYALPQQTAPLAGALIYETALGQIAGGDANLASAVTITAGVPVNAAALTASSPFPATLTGALDLGSAQLDGLGAVVIADAGETKATVRSGSHTHTIVTATGSIDLTAPLVLAAGGTLTLDAVDVVLAGLITAHGGSVSVNTEDFLNGAAQPQIRRGSVTLAAGAGIDTSGLLTASGFSNIAENPVGFAYVNGGLISLTSSGALGLAAGSALDVSSGAVPSLGGSITGGRGGCISLVADDPNIPATAYGSGANANSGAAATPGESAAQALAPVTIDAAIQGFGITGAGSFILAAPSIVIGPAPEAGSGLQVAMPDSFFSSGFSAYTLNGFATAPHIGTDRALGSQATGIVVQPGADLAVIEPQLQPVIEANGAALRLDPVLQPLYLPALGGRGLIQRPGASLTLVSEAATSIAGAFAAEAASGIDIGDGARITVDPGQSVTLRTPSQITDDGTIVAPSGTIALLNETPNVQANAPQDLPGVQAGLSVWVGPDAMLDVSARAVSALDAAGQPYGIVPGGGSIVVGSPIDTANTGAVTSTAAFVFVRPGAVLDAAGASALINPEPASPLFGAAPAASLATGTRRIASAGGTIGISSGSGIYLDGTMLAPGGGPGAEGGTLELQLDTGLITVASGSPPPVVPRWFLTPHRILISQDTLPSSLPATLAPGETAFLRQTDSAGQADLSMQQIAAGGFASLFLLARDQIAFDGTVSLNLPQSVSLIDGTISDTSPSASVAIAAPYVLVAGAPRLPLGGAGGETSELGGPSNPTATFSKSYQPCFVSGASCATGTLSVDAGLIDIAGAAGFGATEKIVGVLATSTTTSTTMTQTLDVSGFEQVSLLSSGDIRFVPGAADQPASLESAGNVTLDAAQIYPSTDVSATVIAGVNDFAFDIGGTRHPTGLFAQGTLIIGRTTAAAPAAPLSAFGTLDLSAGVIEQGGILRAPLGLLEFGAVTPPSSRSVGTGVVSLLQLLPGSETSVSGAGLIIPYGGTTDGITYSYDGQKLTFQPAAYGYIPGSANGGLPQIEITNIALTDVEKGAVLDLAGGGTLIGGGGEVILNSGTLSTVGTLASQGFVYGRGGSVDTLVSPFPSFNATTLAVTQPTLAQDPIYAIVPTLSMSAAPTTPLDSQASYYGSIPTIGEQITIGGGVPGLPAGTYTLLPSYYALLPRGYRVQFTGTAGLVSGNTRLVADQTYAADGLVGVAGTTVRSNQPIGLLITTGAGVRAYSQYDEQGYASFATAQAAVFGTPRPYLPQDAGVLDLGFADPRTLPLEPNQTLTATIPFVFDGTLLQNAAPGGYDGAVAVGASLLGSPSSAYEILSPGQAPTLGDISLTATSLDALRAPLLLLGGSFQGFSGGAYEVDSAIPVASSVTVRSGATLTGNAIWLLAESGVTVEPGATLNSLGLTATLPDSASTGVVLSVSSNPFTSPSFAAVVVANGSYQFLPVTAAAGAVKVGESCSAQGACETAPVQLLSEGLVGLFAGGDLAIAPNTRFGARDLVLSIPEINIGTPAPGATAPGGLSLSQSELDLLLAGDPTIGAPPLQALDLEASQSLNFFGTTVLDATGVGQSGGTAFVLTTPAIYGDGGPGDTATLKVGDLVWNGTGGAPGPVIVSGPGTGSGTLVIQADTLTLGYPAQSQGQDQTTIERLILGFSDVAISASQEIVANNHSALGVYQTSTLGTLGSLAYQGGQLSLSAPLLTTAPGSILALATGGAVQLNGGAGAVAPAGGLGGEIDITGQSITDAARIALPGGKLVLDASGNIDFAAGAVVDLAGGNQAFFDVSQGVAGGTLQVSSSTGNIAEEANATIDVGSSAAAAGVVSASAPNGSVLLDGTVLGAAPAADAGGQIDLRAASLGDFVALNRVLDAGSFTGARSFELMGAGDIALAAGDTLSAHSVTIAVDQGALDIEGTIDASGAAPGTIRLAASNGLTLGPSSLLNTSGTVLQCASGPCTDFAGDPAQDEPVAALNAGAIELTVATAVGGAANAAGLAIAPGATLDLASPDGASRGDIQVNVPRTSATSGDANIDAPGAVNIRGASDLAVNAFWAYSPDTSNALAGGDISQASLASFNADSTAFIGHAEAGGTLTGPLAAKLAGLATGANAAIFHLRPGVELQSSADVAGGALTIVGDLDLSQFRYASVNQSVAQPGGAIAGAGEPGVLWIRASGDLNVYGSITDGFNSATAPGYQGWALYSGTQYATTILSTPVPVTLAKGTTFAAVPVALNYSVTLDAGAQLAANATLPTDATLNAAVKVSTSFVATAFITVPNGPTYPPGSVVPPGRLPAGTRLAAGLTLPFTVALGGAAGANSALTWPAGASLSLFGSAVTLGGEITLHEGNIIPVQASLILGPGTNENSRNPAMVLTRPQGGQEWAVATPLPTGDLSWSLRIVGGADLASADSRAVLPSTNAGVTLADTHWTVNSKRPSQATDALVFSVVRTGTGYLDLLSGGNITEDSPFGIYTAGSATGTAAIGTLTATFTDGGGNVLVSAQQDLGGFAYADGSLATANSGTVNVSSMPSDWLIYGTSAAGMTDWGVNFGRVARDQSVIGFSGIGALGGGNVTVLAGGNAGQVSPVTSAEANFSQYVPTDAALIIATASAGQVNPGTGAETLAGGGAVTVSIGGGYDPGAPVDNPNAASSISLTPGGGAIADLRGPIHVEAGSLGNVVLPYAPNSTDPRQPSPFVSETFFSGGGPELLPGDSLASVTTRGDLALDSVQNPTLDVSVSNAVFSLWQPNTAVSVTSLGGNVVPWQGADGTAAEVGGVLYPPILNATAFSQNIYFGSTDAEAAASAGPPVLELVPSPEGNFTLLAGSSIYDPQSPNVVQQASLDISGASTAPANVATPLTPEAAHAGAPGNYFATGVTDSATGTLHVGDPVPARAYALGGDIVGLLTGQGAVGGYGPIAAKALDVEAGGDIVSFGEPTTAAISLPSNYSPNYILNNNASDISSLIAGGNIIYANVQIAGPGSLYVQAGGNVYQGSSAVIESLGEIGAAATPATRNSGAGITVLAGVGPSGPDYMGFAQLYLNPSHLADPSIPVQDQRGKVVRSYSSSLVSWLAERYGYVTTDPSAALAYFATLPIEQRGDFLLGIYFIELNQSGLDYNNPASRFFHSYLEGEEAISSLFPGTDLTGRRPATGGGLTLFTSQEGTTTLDGGIRTDFGGSIDLVVPEGATTLGNYGISPGADAGIVTQGSGNIDVYSYGSVFLGQSRILTTLGGNVLIWLSSNGQINAGRGANTTQIAAPLGITYDIYGNVSLSPTAPASGAGIGALAPIPQIPPGNVNLIAPVGTIDAGEAGIRASGNVNLAALTLLNAANIQSGGKTVGVPTVATASAAAASAASAAAGAATQTASESLPHAAPIAEPSIFDVEVIAIGGTYEEEKRKTRPLQ